ncbi:MAG: amino acid ABC transporter permease [Anaerolineae bacterium]|jgi:polar amino acid transport system permease protein|nr:amino acid ABC transporter permease [Anaerolineae bacterium]
MIAEDSLTPAQKIALRQSRRQRLRTRLATFPWWLVIVGLIIGATLWLITKSPTYSEAFATIRTGMVVTLVITLISYTISLLIGLFTGLGRVSSNIVSQNIATLYVEVMRGIPMLVSIFFIALVLVPGIIEMLSFLGSKFTEAGLTGIGASLANMNTKSISMSVRAVIALSLTYGAYSAEIFRAGIQSVPVGQMEAARSQGMSYGQAMRNVVLPQAIRNVLPAIGNDFISMLKDSSLVSILAVRDITQIARLYAGHSFRYPEAYTTLSVMYLTMTMLLSLLVKLLERRLANNGK